jgi:hypothetical protein
MSTPDTIRRLRWLAACAIFCAWIAAGVAVAGMPVGFEAAQDSISAQGLKSHVDFLAADEREGREAGSRGGQAAGNYVAAQLAALPLQGAGSDHGYFQPFAPNYRNVLALLEGSDPDLKDQVIVVGAHYDHVGFGLHGNSLGEPGAIHHGADDNASGTAGGLELAKALCRLAQPPRRSVLFVFFDAEERGMLGSRHWVAHPTLPLDRVVMMINLDMIGRLRDELLVYGLNSGYGFRRLVSSHNGTLPMSIDFRRTVYPKADHFPFFSKDIPVLFFHTGLHPQYHRPSDTAELINASGMRRVVRLAFGVLCDVAGRDERPQLRAASRSEGEGNKPEVIPLPPVSNRPLRVGVTWRLDDAEPGSVVLVRVAADSPAARAGLQPEDRIYQVNGLDFADDGELSRLLKTLPGPIRLLVERRGQLRTVEIQLAAAAERRAA